MKLLFDENLSPRLATLLGEQYPGSIHVRDVGLASSTDREVWDYAKEYEFGIVSKDSDFHQRSLLEGAPPKIVWIRRGNCSTVDIQGILSRLRARISDFGEDRDAAFLVIE